MLALLPSCTALTAVDAIEFDPIIPKEEETPGMTMVCKGSNCTATISDVGTGFIELPDGNTTVTYDATQAVAVQKFLCFQKTVCDTKKDGIPTIVAVAGVGIFIIPDCKCLTSPIICFKGFLVISVVTYSSAPAPAVIGPKPLCAVPYIDALPYKSSGYEYALIDEDQICEAAGTGDFNQDGEFDVLDVVSSITMMTTDVLPDITIPLDCYIDTVDLNEDGEMNVLDLTLMTKKIAG